MLGCLGPVPRCPAGSLAAYKRSLELYSKEKAALKMAKAKAQKRGTTGSTLPNGTAKEGNASASMQGHPAFASQNSWLGPLTA